jgi:GAF domain-containing protein
VVARDDGSACGRTLGSGKTVLLEDIEKDSEFAPFLPVAREAGFRSVISAPLLTYGSELVGVVATHFANVHRPTDIEIDVFEQYGSLAADHLHKLLGQETLASVAVAMNNRLYDSLAAASHRVDLHV